MTALWAIVAVVWGICAVFIWGLWLVSRLQPQKLKEAEAEIERQHKESTALRTQVSIAEDGLREICSPDCGSVDGGDGFLRQDLGAYVRVAEGTLRRMTKVDVEFRELEKESV